MNNRTKTINNTHRSFGLDLIRAIAICIVLGSHFVKKIDIIGFWGVELFFVLSGFLIGQILWRNFSSIGKWGFKNASNFWSRRWWRTLPNYYLFLVLMLLFSNSLYLPMPSSVAQFSKFLWFGQDLLNSNIGFYTVSWSLCIEEWFYLLFPIWLLLFSGIGCKRKTAFTLTIIVFIAASIVIRFYLNKEGVDSIRGVTLARLDSIGYGVAMAYIAAVFSISNKLKQAVFVLGVLILILSGFWIYHSGRSLQQLSHSQIMLLLLPVSASLLLWQTAMLTRFTGKFEFFSICIEKLSLWTYSIYLSHIPILFAVYYLTSTIRTNTYGNVFSKLLGLAVTILVSSYLFNYFELPLTKKRPKEIVG